MLYKTVLVSLELLRACTGLWQIKCAKVGRTKRTAGGSTEPYEGPIPVTMHVHGAHIKAQNDGYPMSWHLPSGKNIPTG